MAIGSESPPPVIVQQPAATALQLGGESLRSVTAALSAQPIMLTVVLLNLVFVSIAGYFLLQLEKYRANNLTSLIDLMRSCVLETAPLARESNRDVNDLRQELDDLRAKERARDRTPTPP